MLRWSWLKAQIQSEILEGNLLGLAIYFKTLSEERLEKLRKLKRADTLNFNVMGVDINRHLAEASGFPDPCADFPRYNALLEMADLVSRHHKPAELFRDLTSHLCAVFRFDFINFALCDSAQAIVTAHYSKNGISMYQPQQFALEDCWEGWVQQNQSTVSIDIDTEHRFVRGLRPIRDCGMHSYLVLPLTIAHDRLGAIGFGGERRQAFPSGDRTFLHRVAQVVALCIHNMFNRATLVEERDRLRSLLEIDAARLHRVDENQRIKLTLEFLQKLFPKDQIGIYLSQDASQPVVLHTAESVVTGDFVPNTGHTSLEQSLAGKVFRTQEIEVLDSDLMEPTSHSPECDLELRIKSICMVPLLVPRGPLGVLSVGRRSDHYFPKRDVEMLMRVATTIAPILDSANTQRALQRERQQTEALIGINNALAASQDLEQFFPKVSTHLRRVFHQEYASCVLYENENGLVARQAIDFPLTKGLVTKERVGEEGHWPTSVTMSAGTPMIFSRREMEVFEDDFTSCLLQEGIKTICCVPLGTTKEPLGCLNLGSTRKNAFNPDHFSLLFQVATQVAIALENGRAKQELIFLRKRLDTEELYLKGEIHNNANFEEIIGESPVLASVLDQAATVATSDATVLILGETGTGKELVARAVHRMSRRKERSFIKVNCAALPSGLLESELFGHEKGAFTGAVTQKIGRMELADQGTLFLDEVGELPLELQPKLLRVLQDQEFERLGSTRTIKVNVRLIAATNRNLRKRISQGEFRSDLFYRLNVFPVMMPPLRERREDICQLVRHFVNKHARRMDRNIESIPRETMNTLENWNWPGNVRELENFIERSVILSNGSTLRVPLEALIVEAPEPDNVSGTLLCVERDHIIRALRETGGRISGLAGAAQKLGIKRTTLQSMMQRLEITRDDYT